MRVLSLGWGVQSWGLAAMSALGTLPKLDLAIHADTGWEYQHTYRFARKWTPWLRRHGIPVFTVHDQDQSYQLLTLHTQPVHLPAFTTWPDASNSGTLRRQCSYRWKIRPLRSLLRRLLVLQGRPKAPGSFEQWIGITADEAKRAKPSNVQWVPNRYPYLDDLNRPFTRHMVIQWLRRHNLEVPQPSSCIICPYHDHDTWRRLKASHNGDWHRAVAVDRAIRHRRPGYVCYLHRSRQPLEEARLGIEQTEQGDPHANPDSSPGPQ